MQKDNQDQSAGKSSAAGNNPLWIYVAAIVIILVAGAVYFVLRSPVPGDSPAGQSAGNAEIKDQATGETKTLSFATPKKSAHYESNTPAHGAVLAGPPINVVINFNFDLAPPSAISVKMDGKEYGLGETAIDANKLAMRKVFDAGAPDGLYDVTYNACWPDGSCHDGRFQFAVDRSLSGSFTDLRGQKEVAVKMKNIAFDPKEIIVSPGTKVTWTQEDNVEHFVNTETHPAHTYFPAQNSRGLSLGGTFSVVFEKPGAYPYHCSAHASVMTGTVLVE